MTPAESLENPILNSPYEPPAEHFVLGPNGPTGEVKVGRRPSEAYIPVPVGRRRRGAAQAEQAEQDSLDFDVTGERREVNSLINDIRARVDRWRRLSCVQAGLVVVAHDADLDAGPASSSTNRSLGRVHVLVLVHDEVAKLRMHRRPHRLPLELPHGSLDLLSVGEQPVALQGVEVLQEHGAERLGHGARVEQLGLDDVDALQEAVDGEKPLVHPA